MPVAYRRARRTEPPSRLPLERLPRGGRGGRGGLLRGFRRRAGAAAGRGRAAGGSSRRPCSAPIRTPTTSSTRASSGLSGQDRPAVGDRGLAVEALSTPGHSDDMVAFVVNGEAVFTGDTLFKDSVGGGNFEQVRQSVMDVLMSCRRRHASSRAHRRDDDRAGVGGEPVHPSLARGGAGRNGAGPRRRRGRNADRLVAGLRRRRQGWVRFDDGRDAIVGGSRVERTG